LALKIAFDFYWASFLQIENFQIEKILPDIREYIR